MVQRRTRPGTISPSPEAPDKQPVHARREEPAGECAFLEEASGLPAAVGDTLTRLPTPS